MRTRNLIMLSCSLLLSTSVPAQNLSGNNDGNNKITTEDFPAAQSNQKQVVIKLPAKADPKNERDYKVELIAGKNMMVDCNHHGLNGIIEEETLEGSGFKYYTFTTTGDVWATRMGCPENSNHEEFVTAKPLMIEYNSQVPVVVYVPAGYEIKYRVWSAGEIMEAGNPADNYAVNDDALYQTWEWASSEGGHTGGKTALKNTGLSKIYTFKKDGTYLHYKNRKMVPAGKFQLSNDFSIFIKGKLPMIELAGKDRKMSYMFNGRDTLILSEECYDCYKHVYVRKSKNITPILSKIQDCPDVMIENRMPRIIDRNVKTKPAPSSYYIYKGKRREISEFDAEWVKKNCDVKVELVY